MAFPVDPPIGGNFKKKNKLKKKKITEIKVLVAELGAGARFAIKVVFFVPRWVFQHAQRVPLKLHFNAVFQDLAFTKP